MGLYVALFIALIGVATLRAVQEKKRRVERRRRMLENLRTALDA